MENDSMRREKAAEMKHAKRQVPTGERAGRKDSEEATCFPVAARMPVQWTASSM
jgi:hypothetical protein